MRVVVGHTEWVHIGDAEYFAVCVAKAFLKAENLLNAGSTFLIHESTFPEVFYYEFYKDLDTKGRVVTYIEAYVSNTAIYFLPRGAGHVRVAELNPMITTILGF